MVENVVLLLEHQHPTTKYLNLHHRPHVEHSKPEPQSAVWGTCCLDPMQRGPTCSFKATGTHSQTHIHLEEKDYLHTYRL